VATAKSIHPGNHMIKIETYPTSAWILQPSFKPIAVEMVKRKYDHGYPDWHAAVSGKAYHESNLHPTLEDAIAAGRAKIIRLEADLTKRRANVDKRIAALNKAGVKV